LRKTFLVILSLW